MKIGWDYYMVMVEVFEVNIHHFDGLDLVVGVHHQHRIHLKPIINGKDMDITNQSNQMLHLHHIPHSIDTIIIIHQHSE